MNDENKLNPEFYVELIDISRAQSSIVNSRLNETLRFIINDEGRIEVYATNSSKYFGIIAKKDTNDFSLIYDYPEFFEGEVSAKKRASYSSYKVKISIKVKPEASYRVFKKDIKYLNKLVFLKNVFDENEIILSNYGKVKVIKVFEDCVLAYIPHLGTRMLYDLLSLEKYHD